MSFRIIYFGWNDCYRVQVLRSAGYEVKELTCLGGLIRELRNDLRVDLVIVSEGDMRSTEQAAELVQRYRVAPVVLFRRNQNILDETRFTRVLSSFIEPRVWLREIAAVIESGRDRQSSRN